MSKKSFDFDDNPANQFISVVSSPGVQKQTTPQAEPKSSKIGKGKKDKRICVMLQSALHDDLAKIARVKGNSKNEVFCRAVKEYRDNERRDLERYRTLFEELDVMEKAKHKQLCHRVE
jgi:hypothetical protein